MDAHYTRRYVDVCFQTAHRPFQRPKHFPVLLPSVEIWMMLGNCLSAHRLLWLQQKNALLEEERWLNVMEAKWSEVLLSKGYCCCGDTARRRPDELSLTPADTMKSLCTLGFENAATSRRLRRGLVRAANWIWGEVEFNSPQGEQHRRGHRTAVNSFPAADGLCFTELHIWNTQEKTSSDTGSSHRFSPFHAVMEKMKRQQNYVSELSEQSSSNRCAS